jgi:hypothetical protein
MPELDDIIIVSKNGHVETPDGVDPRKWYPEFGRVEKYASSQYGTSGRVSTAGGLYDETGRTGLRHWGGFIFEEWLRELQTGKRAAEVYREMADSDPVIGAILYVIEMLSRRVDWWMEPASTKPQDQENAAFAWSVYTDTYHSFDDMIGEILSFLQYGWSYFETVYKRRMGPSGDPRRKSKYTDGKIGLRKLGIRSQDSLWKWVFDDDGEMIGMIQNPPPDYQIRYIPYEKAVNFRTKPVKDNPEGRSVLRNAYRPWYFLKNLQNIEGIGVERDLAGLPVLQPPEGVDIWNNEDPVMAGVRLAAQNVVSSIRRDEQEGVLIPFGWELTLLSTGGRRQFDTSAIITRYEQRIASSVLSDVVLLGSDKIGSYALASEKVALLGYSINAYLDTIAAQFNERITPMIFALNGERNFTDFPELCHTPVDTLDLETLGTFLNGMANAGRAGLLEGDDGKARLAALSKRAGLPMPENDIPGIGPDTEEAQDGNASPDTTPRQAAEAADRKMPKDSKSLAKPVKG